jgi:hypothetical protein
MVSAPHSTSSLFTKPVSRTAPVDPSRSPQRGRWPDLDRFQQGLETLLDRGRLNSLQEGGSPLSVETGAQYSLCLDLPATRRLHRWVRRWRPATNRTDAHCRNRHLPQIYPDAIVDETILIDLVVVETTQPKPEPPMIHPQIVLREAKATLKQMDGRAARHVVRGNLNPVGPYELTEHLAFENSP